MEKKLKQNLIWNGIIYEVYKVKNIDIYIIMQLGKEIKNKLFTNKYFKKTFELMNKIKIEINNRLKAIYLYNNGFIWIRFRKYNYILFLKINYKD